MFDMYSLKARIFPMVLLFLPLVVLGLFYSLEFTSIYQSLTSIGLLASLSFLLSQLGRDAGLRKQVKLWEEWGGAPSVQLLRWDNNRIDRYTKARYHHKLLTDCPVATIPTPSLEQTNPDETNAVYSAWCKFLISKTRDENKFSLLFRDNISYGFRRNLWGLKKLSVIFLLLALAGNYLFWAVPSGNYSLHVMPANAFYAQVALVLMLLFWLLVVTKRWVKVPAFSYGERLLEATDQI